MFNSRKVLGSREKNSNTLMASSADSKNPLPTQSSPAAPPAYCSPASPTGKGLSTSRLEARPTGLSRRLRETHFLLRQATDGSVTLAQAPGDLPQKPPISLAPPSTWHLKRIGRHHPWSLEALVSRDKFYKKNPTGEHTPEFSLGLLGFFFSTPLPSASPTASVKSPSLILTQPCLAKAQPSFRR